MWESLGYADGRFNSHSHSDETIAFRLVSFLLATLRIEEEAILCTSNPDQGLSYSSHSITDQLKHQLKTAEAIVILITSDSLHSAWIPFEAGSFWTTDKPIIPILGPGLTQNDLPGLLRNFLSIAISQANFADQLNSAINQLASQLKIEQRFTNRRSHTLKEFSQHLTNWTSKYPNSKAAPQKQVEKLTKELEELQSSHNQQLEEIKTASQQEKEQIQIFYQAQIKELQQSNQEQLQQEKSFQSQIQELEQQLQQAKSSLLQQQLSEKSLQSRIQELEQLQPTTIVSNLKIISETRKVELRSEKGVDYTKLRNFLQKQQWKEADKETVRVMLQAGNIEDLLFDVEDIENFPCPDLRTIDNLWLHYSESKFGFTVQKEIYESLGGTEIYDEEIWNSFGDFIRWSQQGRWIWREYKRAIPKIKVVPQINEPLLGRFPTAVTLNNEMSLLSIQDNSKTLFIWMIHLFARIEACKS